MTRRTILDHTPDGLGRRLHDMERQIADLQRVRNPLPTYREATGSSDFPHDAGTASIADGATSETVVHELGYIPETILLTPRLSAETVAVGTRSAVEFTAIRSGSTGALGFDWLVTGPEPLVGDYRELVVGDLPLLFIMLDDESGTTAVAEVGNDGTYVGNPPKRQAGPSAAIPYAIAMDGVDDHVGIGTISGLGASQPQTWEIWVRSTSEMTPTTSQGWVFATGTSGVTTSFGGDFTGSFTDEVLTISTGSGAATAFTGFTVSANVWHHHVITYSGAAGGWTYYVDGNPIGTKQQTGGGATGFTGADVHNLGWYIGKSQFEGLAALAVYDYEMTAAQVLEHYAVGSGSTPPDGGGEEPPPPPADDYLADIVTPLSPTYFWPLQADLAPAFGGITLTDQSTPTVTYTTGPGMDEGTDQAADSAAIQLIDNNTINTNANTTGYSYGGWFRFDALAADKGIISNANSAGNGVILRIESATQISVWHGVNSRRILVNHGMSTGVWYHLMVTWDGSTITLYKDGTPLGTNAYNAALASVTLFTVGPYNRRGGAARMDGAAAWVGWWVNTCLTQAQVQALAGL